MHDTEQKYNVEQFVKTDGWMDGWMDSTVLLVFAAQILVMSGKC